MLRYILSFDTLCGPEALWSHHRAAAESASTTFG